MAKQIVSRACTEGYHEWCMNRDHDECRCTCKCHNVKRRRPASVVASRKRFEEVMTAKFKTMETLFKAFGRYPKGDRWAGKYLRGEVQSMWEGWELHRATQSDAGDERER